MAHTTMTDDLDRRLRAARPADADVDEHAVDEALLSRLQALPLASRRRIRPTVAVPVAAGLTVATAAAVLLAGPGEVGGPSPASALTRTLRWLDPPAGTVLHARSVETEGTRRTIREFWQSAADPQRQRERVEGAATFEVSGDAIYDPATDTIYDGGKAADGGKPARGDGPATDKRRAADLTRTADDATKAAQIAAQGAPPANEQPSPGAAPAPGRVDVKGVKLPPGDPIVAKVRVLLQLGHATVVKRTWHAGVATWEIALKEGVGRPTWRLWVDASSGRPIELQDPGRDAGHPAQVIRWETYEVLPAGSGTAALLTLHGAHPSAHVVHDGDQWQAAEERLIAVRP